MNLVIQRGRLVHTPELKNTTNGKSVVSFTLAQNDKFNKETSYFFDCTAWGKTAETLCNYCEKGREIEVKGRLTTRSYEDKSGNKKKLTEIIVDEFEFIGGKAETSEPRNGTPNSDFKIIDDDDDLPWNN